jgi:hypothetical protein
VNDALRTDRILCFGPVALIVKIGHGLTLSLNFEERAAGQCGACRSCGGEDYTLSCKVESRESESIGGRVDYIKCESIFHRANAY